ncbi:MAG: oxidoreductase [Promethearchaeota archaeon]
MAQSNRKKKKWTKFDIPELLGKVAVVTGANSGTGFEVTKALSAKGAHVVLACRNMEKGTKAIENIQKAIPNASLELIRLDLADLSSISAFTDAFNSKFNSLNILCNNAGVYQTPYLKTKDNFELQFGTNHLGHFALTGLLIDVLLKTKGARVVTMSSCVHILGKINFDTLNEDNKKSYRPITAYFQSKLANLLFAYELQRRLEKAGANVISIGVHPGYPATNLQLTGPGLNKSLFGKLIVGIYKISNKIIAQSAEMGALPMLMAATSPDMSGGSYIGPSGVMGFWGYPKLVRSSKRSYDLGLAKKLWEISEELTRIKYL